MSMITRCPSCSTVFKVVADQLKVSGGWVRCGHCSEVFDAQAALQPGPATAVAPPIAPPIAPPTAPPTASAPAAVPMPVSPPHSEPSPSQMPQSDWVPDSRWRPDPAVYPASDSSLWGPSSVLPDVSFVRQGRPSNGRSGLAVRALQAGLCMVLLVALGLQVVVHERNRLAAQQPQTKPWLAQLCQYAGCELAALRQIEAVVIDSSSFNKLRADTYRLNVAIKNTQPLELQMPSLELSLTDAQDQPLLRRVLGPGDLGASAVLPANGEFVGSVAMQVDKSANPALANIAGYRVLAFYP